MAECDRNPPWNPDDLVWPARNGGMHALGYDAGLEQALERTKIARHIRFHDLRHTCASHLLRGTWAPTLIREPLRVEEVRVWLDHSDIGVTPDAMRGKVVDARETHSNARANRGPTARDAGPRTGAIFGI